MFRTRSQLPLPPTYSRSAVRLIVVHDYSLESAASTSESSPESVDEILRRARAAAGHDALWQKVRVNGQRKGTSTPLGDARTDFLPSRRFEFARSPPRIHSKRSPQDLAEWNTLDIPLSGDDIFEMHALEEFQNTDISSFRATIGTPKRFATEASVVGEPLLKRQKLEVGTLSNVIPQPHIVTSTSVATKKSTSPAYSRTKPIPIPPHTLPLPDPPPYTRRTWVIPVRGTLPWQHATSAVVLLDSTDPNPPSHDDELAWTPPALSAFWAFLLKVCEKKQLGPLGLSFHVSQYSSANSNSHPAGTGTYTEYSVMGAQPVSLSLDSEPPSAVSSVRQLPLPVTTSIPLLLSVDHIKVYHDAINSMVIRNVLDAWRFESGSCKIRLLKGARLVLLDERSKGILVV